MRLNVYAPVVALAVFTVIVFAANISLGVWYGRLSNPPTYDDISYLFDAFKRYYIWGDRSLLAVLGSFIENPPHAPLTTMIAMAGYAVAGPSVISPYLANIAAFASYVAVVYWIAKPLCPLARTLITATSLFLPAAHALANEFRPDMTAGMLFAVAIYTVTTIRPGHQSKAALFGLGAFLTFAVTAKPSSLIISVPIIGIASSIGIIRSISQSGFREGARVWMPVIISAGALFAVFISIFGTQTISYIYRALVTNADVWKLDRSTYYHWTYHSFGSGGRTMFGLFFWPLLIAIVLDILRAAFTRRDMWPSFSYAGILMIIYLGMAPNPSKTVYQGCFFYFPFAIAGFAATVRLLSINNKSSVRISILIFISSLLFMPAATSIIKNPPNETTKAVVDEIVAHVRSRVSEREVERCPARPLVIASLGVDPTTAMTVALMVGLEARIEMRDTSPYSSRSQEHVMSVLSAADFVIVPASEHVERAPYKLPSLAFSDLARTALSKNGWRKIDLPRVKGGIGSLHVSTKC